MYSVSLAEPTRQGRAKPDSILLCTSAAPLPAELQGKELCLVMMRAAGMAQLPDRGVSEGDTLVFDYPGEDEKRKDMKTCRNTHQAQQTGAHQSGGGGGGTDAGGKPCLSLINHMPVCARMFIFR